MTRYGNGVQMIGEAIGGYNKKVILGVALGGKRHIEMPMKYPIFSVC